MCHRFVRCPCRVGQRREDMYVPAKYSFGLYMHKAIVVEGNCLEGLGTMLGRLSCSKVVERKKSTKSDGT